jgi:hypothetical protein
VRRLLGGIGLTIGLTLLGMSVDAQSIGAAPPPTTEPTAPVDELGTVTGGGGVDSAPAMLPLVPVPTGCEAPALPHIVFVGSVIDRDFRTIRFEIERIRSGRSAPFAAGKEVDVRFGLDAQYLDDDAEYLVSAVVDEDLGLLVSRATPPIENFGGDEVIGVSETDVDCPTFDDPKRTMHLDGTEIEGGVLEPFLRSRVQIVGAFLLPLGLSVGVIFLLATFRLSLAGLYHSIVDSTRGRGR